ncbi:MAG: ABC transporter permease, partial [Microbacterium sp.]
ECGGGRVTNIRHEPPAVAADPAAAADGAPIVVGRSRVATVLLHLLGHSWIALLLAFVVSLPVGLVLVVSTGADPGKVVGVTFEATVGTTNGIVNTLVYATPRLFVALGAIVALRCGLFNMGGEGQLQFGAVGAVLGGYYLGRFLPAPLGLVAALLGAALLGGLWAVLAALFKLWRGTDEMIVTLLMNFVATYFVLFLLQGPLREADSSYNQSERIPDAAHLPRLFDTRLHLGVLLVAAMVVAVWFLFSRTRRGLEMRSVGLNPIASRYQGLPIRGLLVGGMILSGAIAGLAGANEVLGTQYRLIQGFSAGYGFEGLAIAFLAGLQPGRAAVLAVVFGAIYSAASSLQQSVGVSASIAYVIEGVPIVLLAAFSGVQSLMARRRRG